ncbi:MAG: DNA double-strand break repair nuclease NurA [Micromonosporaceae bacterium]
MRVHIDAWDPSYGSAYEEADGPRGESGAPVNPEVERETAAWQPLAPGPDVRPPGVVLLVDGVRRIDARLWVEADDGESYQGICASYAAGVVRCDLRRGVAELAGTRVAHGLFAPGPKLAPIAAHPTAVFQPHRVTGGDPRQVELTLQRRMQELEVEVSDAVRGDGEQGADPDDLLVADGPLRGRRGLERTVGYAKTHHIQYLPPELVRVVTALRPGQRTPLFGMGGHWQRYSWYLRLPGAEGAPWAGVVRLECPAEQPVSAAARLADVCAVTLPRFAATAYKDPRAPQNLVPIAGLERRLRGLLGDPRLLQRGLRTATMRPAVPA